MSSLQCREYNARSHAAVDFHLVGCIGLRVAHLHADAVAAGAAPGREAIRHRFTPLLLSGDGAEISLFRGWLALRHDGHFAEGGDALFERRMCAEERRKHLGTEHGFDDAQGRGRGGQRCCGDALVVGAEFL
jgi:hypothetical protein